MRKTFLAFLLIYLNAFLFFKEEVHSFSHHLKEINHVHSLKCFFEGGEEKKSGLGETCHFHDLFFQDSQIAINFFSLEAPSILNFTYYFSEKVFIGKNFIFFSPPSRAPPSLS